MERKNFSKRKRKGEKNPEIEGEEKLVNKENCMGWNDKNVELF